MCLSQTAGISLKANDQNHPSRAIVSTAKIIAIIAGMGTIANLCSSLVFFFVVRNNFSMNGEIPVIDFFMINVWIGLALVAVGFGITFWGAMQLVNRRRSGLRKVTVGLITVAILFLTIGTAMGIGLWTESRSIVIAAVPIVLMAFMDLGMILVLRYLHRLKFWENEH